MNVDEITNKQKVEDVITENRCPFCKQNGVVEQLGGESSIGVVNTKGKHIPTKQWYDFLCRHCKRSFMISVYQFDEISQKRNINE